jgi:hypothetical protein
MPKRKTAIVWRGEPGAALPETSRLVPVACALENAGFSVEAVSYSEEASGEARARLLGCDGALVWVDPLDDGRDRVDLDTLLRDVARAGVWVSAHPDVILKIGTKEILYATRNLGWGGDTALYRSVAEFRREFPDRLEEHGIRVLKRYRGNGGQGVWKVAAAGGSKVRLQEATHRDGRASEMPLDEFLALCEAYFEGEGRLIDQEFCPRIVEGMVRCYMCGGELAGFGRQYPAGYGGEVDAGRTFGLPAAKTMLPPEEPQFSGLRKSLERDWTPAMQQVLGVDDGSLPALWDADFLFGTRSADGADTFRLCEINASCVTPFPPLAPEKIAARVRDALAR